MNLIDYFNKSNLIPPDLKNFTTPSSGGSGSKWKGPVKVVFPTLKEVDKSFAGRPVRFSFFLSQTSSASIP